jgi:ribonuclease HII
MSLFIGMDEAGYGPNLGPLVITVTVWELPTSADQFDLWDALASVVSQSAKDFGDKLHIADSKIVHNSSRGLGPLERSVIPLLKLAGHEASCLRTLCQALDPQCDLPLSGEPWYANENLSLPTSPSNTNERLTQSLLDRAAEAGIFLKSIRSRIVLTREFNDLVAKYGSKGVALSQLSLGLLFSVWKPGAHDIVVCDKHGGRNRYDDLLADHTGEFIFRVQEGRERSVYRIGTSELRFQMKAEQHLPVAAASLVSKYLRETTMELFNRFWTAHLPELKPTKGYPEDAARFRRDTESKRAELGIGDDVFWRCR